MRKTPGGHMHHHSPPSSRAVDQTLNRRPGRPPLRGVGLLPHEGTTRDNRADPPATSPSRWAAPGSQELRGSSPALPSYSCFAAGRRDAEMRLGARFGVTSPHGQPDRPAPLRPVPGRPEPRPRRPGRARARRFRALRTAVRGRLREPGPDCSTFKIQPPVRATSLSRS